MKRNDFQDLKTRIAYTRVEFTPIDDTIANFLESSASLEEIIELGLTGIAESCYVSKASVSRFFRKIGFSSYDEFRFHSELSSNKLLDDEMLVKTLYGRYLDLLDQQVQLIEMDQIKQLVHDIQNHHVTYVVGAGKSAIYANRFAYLLNRLGFTSVSISDSDEIIIKSVVADQKDFYIFISASGNTPSIIKALKNLKKKKVKNALITQFASSPSAQYTDRFLLAPAQTSNTAPSDISCLFIIDLAIIYLTQIDESISKLYDETFSTLRQIRFQTNQEKDK